MRSEITVSSQQREELIDITEAVRAAVAASGVTNGICTVYAQGATSAIMVQENWDASIPTDVVSCLRKLIPKGVWLHDRQDGNGDAHLKAGIVGPSETIPIIDGTLGLSRWQDLFFCHLDSAILRAPRATRQVLMQGGEPISAQAYLRYVEHEIGEANAAEGPESAAECRRSAESRCDFDGPRTGRTAIVTCIADR